MKYLYVHNPTTMEIHYGCEESKQMLTNCFDVHGNIDNDAFNRLADAFRPLISSLASKYYLPGGDREDLMQWGLIGLYKAVQSYEAEAGYSFSYIAKVNIHNTMKSAITMANRQKHRAVNQAQSLQGGSCAGDMSGEVIYDDRLLVAHPLHQDPLEWVAAEESVRDILRLMRECLSKHERQIMSLYMRGYQQRHISGKLQFQKKVVDNAIQRARKKLYNHIYA